MELEEAKKLLKEMLDNCMDKGRTYYEDDERVQKARVIEVVLDTLAKYENQLDLDYVDRNYVSKDIIRAKIEEYEKDKEEFQNYIQLARKKDEDIRYIYDLRFALNTIIGSIRALQELLEEGE